MSAIDTQLRQAIARNDFATLTATTGLVYSHLIVILATGPKRLKIDQIAALCHTSRRATYRAVETLKRRGLIEVSPTRSEHRHRHDATYRLCQLGTA